MLPFEQPPLDQVVLELQLNKFWVWFNRVIKIDSIGFEIRVL